LHQAQVKKKVMEESAAFKGLPKKIQPENWALSENPPKKFSAPAPTGLTKSSPGHLISKEKVSRAFGRTWVGPT
jgi:hypothetical protein